MKIRRAVGSLGATMYGPLLVLGFSSPRKSRTMFSPRMLKGFQYSNFISFKLSELNLSQPTASVNPTDEFARKFDESELGDWGEILHPHTDRMARLDGTNGEFPGQ